MTVINRMYQVGYGAGYSIDDEPKTVYIDCRLPKEFLLDGKWIKTDKYLYIHEVTEKHLMDEYGFKYQHAHEMATRAERKAVEADGVNWNTYQKTILKAVDALGNITGRVPDDLDVKPEHDWHDTHELNEIRSRQVNPQTKEQWREEAGRMSEDRKEHHEL